MKRSNKPVLKPPTTKAEKHMKFFLQNIQNVVVLLHVLSLLGVIEKQKQNRNIGLEPLIQHFHFCELG